MRGKVAKVEDATPLGYPNWVLVSVEGQVKGILVYHNWEAKNGDLKAGDEIEYDLSRLPIYSNAPYSFSNELRRAPKGEIVE